MKKKILGIFLLVVLVLSLVSLTAVASDGYNLIATGTQGTEDRITVDLPGGTTLGQLQSVSWQELLVAGYPPHVDVFIDVEGTEDALTFEYAYNDGNNHYLPLLGNPVMDGVAWGALTSGWYSTFADDGQGPAEITGTSYAWLQSGWSGPWPDGSRDEDPTFPVSYPIEAVVYPEGEHEPFIGGTLAAWVAGNVVTGIDGNTPVTRLEIEVDNWIVDTTAMVRNISANFGGGDVGLSVTVEAVPPQVVSINLDLGNIDFGTVYQGASSIRTVLVTNGGNTAISVATNVVVDVPSPFSYMTVTPSSFGIPVGGSQEVELALNVPGDFAVGSYTSAGALTFTATAQ